MVFKMTAQVTQTQCKSRKLKYVDEAEIFEREKLATPFVVPPENFNFNLHKVYGIQNDCTGHTNGMQKK